MNDTEWGQWVAHHAALFRLFSDEDAEMIRAWRPLLMQFGASELRAASEEIATTKASTFRTEHLQLLRQTVARIRASVAARRMAETPKDAALFGCEVCREGYGNVSVPHLGDFYNGEWNGRYTMIVSCECPMGQVRREQRGGLQLADNKTAMTLSQYVRANAEWMLQMVERDNRRKDELAAEAAASHADTVSGLRRIIADIGKIKNDPARRCEVGHGKRPSK